MMGLLLEAWSVRRNARLLVAPSTHQRRDTGPLDGLRVLAALWVVSTHCMSGMVLMNLSMENYEQVQGNLAYRLVSNGPLGVDVFFVISGLVIMTLLRGEMASAMLSWRSVTAVSVRFLVRRVLRLLPSYAVAIAALYLVTDASSSALGQAQAQLCRDSWWANLLFINNMSGFYTQCLISSWSLAVEMQFYVVSPILVYLTLRFQQHARALLLVACACSVATYIGFATRSFALDGGASYYDTVYQRPHTRLFAYILGMAVAYELEQEHNTDRIDTAPGEIGAIPLVVRRQPPARRRAYALLILAAVAAAILLPIFLRPPTVHPASEPMSNYALDILLRPLFVLCVSYVIYHLLSSPSPSRATGVASKESEAFTFSSYGRGWWRRAAKALLSSTPMYLLAQLSYNIYLHHVTVLFFMFVGPPASILAMGRTALEPHWMLPAFTLLAFSVSGLIAAVVYFTLERPIMNLSNDMFKNRSYTSFDRT